MFKQRRRKSKAPNCGDPSLVTLSYLNEKKFDYPWTREAESIRQYQLILERREKIKRQYYGIFD